MFICLLKKNGSEDQTSTELDDLELTQYFNQNNICCDLLLSPFHETQVTNKFLSTCHLPCNGYEKEPCAICKNWDFAKIKVVIKLPSTQSNAYFIAYIGMLLEYSSVVWDGCTNQDRDASEKLQVEAARLVTELTSSTSKKSYN